MKSQYYKIEYKEKGIVNLTISAGAQNILTSSVLSDLNNTVLELSEDTHLKCLVIDSAEGKTFIGGADLKEMVHFNYGQARTFIKKIYDLCEAIRECPFPVIAKIDGWCLGAGVEIIAACDIRIASTESNFAMPEVKLGIPSVVHAALLPNLIGEGNTRWWLLTGDVITASQGEAWGLINQAVPKERLTNTVEKTINAIIEAEPLAIRAQKQLLNRWETVSLPLALQLSINVFAESFLTDKPNVSIAKFLNKK